MGYLLPVNLTEWPSLPACALLQSPSQDVRSSSCSLNPCLSKFYFSLHGLTQISLSLRCCPDPSAKVNFLLSIPREGLLNLGIIDILCQIILCCCGGGGERGGCSVHCRVFSSIRGFQLLDVSSTSPVVTTDSVSKYFQYSLEGNGTPGLSLQQLSSLSFSQ